VLGPLKLVLIGDSGVGKTSLLLRFADDHFTESFVSTLGVDFRDRLVNTGDKFVKLQIWDTAGQDRFKTITNAFYRSAQGVILVFDVTSMETYEHVEEWLSDGARNAPEGVPKMLVGNKADLADERKVEVEMAESMAERLGMPYVETSAKNSTNVDAAFITMAKSALTFAEAHGFPTKETLEAKKSCACG